MGDVSRRAFQSRSGAVAGSLALAGVAACDSGGDGANRRGGLDGGAGGAGGSAAAFDPSDWDSVRDQFPLTRDLRHFAAFVLATHPRPVADAIERHRLGARRGHARLPG